MSSVRSTSSRGRLLQPWVSARLTHSLPAFSTKERHNNVLVPFLKANVPQLLVSYIYLALNNMFTTMLAMGGWCASSSRSNKDPDEDGKGLCVSSPAPNTAQRSTHMLSVPLKWGIPTTTCVAVLHWLVSQVLSCASIDVCTRSAQAQTQAQVCRRRYMTCSPRQ